MFTQLKSLQLKKASLITSVIISVSIVSLPAYSANEDLGTGGYLRQMQNEKMMKMLDADGDDLVTTSEADTYFNKLFDSINNDSDDSLDANEWAGPSKATRIDLTTGGYVRELRAPKMMGIIDADGDKLVTRSEFIAQHEKIFQYMDTSGDKKISKQEWVAKHVGGN
jgi:hypothetical protein